MSPKFAIKTPKVTASIKAGTVVVNDLVRFRAVVSNNRDTEVTAKAIENAFGNQIAVTAKTVMEVDRYLGGTSVVEGFGVMRPLSYALDSTDWQAEFASATGKKLRHIASNMYMDENEENWSVVIEGGVATIFRDGSDDVKALMASTSKVNPQDKGGIRPLIASDDVGGIVYVDQDGELREGFVFAGVEGNSDLVQVFETDPSDPVEASIEDMGDATTTVVNRLQVLAFEAFEPMDFGEVSKQDVLDYYRTLYSNHPTAMETLRNLIG